MKIVGRVYRFYTDSRRARLPVLHKRLAHQRFILYHSRWLTRPIKPENPLASLSALGFYTVSKYSPLSCIRYLLRLIFSVVIMDTSKSKRSFRLARTLLTLSIGIILHRNKQHNRTEKEALRIRKRLILRLLKRDLSERKFQRSFQTNRKTFNRLLSLLRSGLELDSKQALRSSGGLVYPDVRLTVTLRFLASSYLDSMILFGLSLSVF